MFSLISCQHKQEKESRQNKELIIFHAGSLSIPFMQLEKEFEKLHPEINVVREAAGSVACARKITDLKRDCDLMASADYKVIEDFLIPVYVDTAIRFATNEMVICYQENSREVKRLSVDNWFDILLQKDVRFGRSDPNSDPCGYRTMLMLQLAGKYYNQPGLMEKFRQKDARYMRPKETDLIALLQTDNLDYVFIYKSIAQQMNLAFLSLPDSINLGNPALSEHYRTASFGINGKVPGEKIIQYGEVIIYGIATLKNPPNPENAKLFLDFLFSETGQSIIEKNGQRFLSH
ncbi:MAG: extracellular solute-binding protein [Bacteroidetes bacterium]|nr:extracellular solute-binding protein [Bacteroidota bacterium]